MAKSPSLNVVLCWHMHQPEYRDLATGEFELPWTYLHGIKEYADMAHHLESVTGARAVVNFSPLLLDQLAGHVSSIRRHRAEGSPINDPHLDALASIVLPANASVRRQLVQDCLRAHETLVIERYPSYQRLATLARLVLSGSDDDLAYVSDRFLADLLVWHHLAWFGEHAKRSDPRLRRLLKKARGFTHEDRLELLDIIETELDALPRRYAALAESGQVELSMTPYAHPMLPLLLDMASATEALPDIALPDSGNYPGGEARARWHIEAGLETFQRLLGRSPCGCFPAEGGLCERSWRLLSSYGLRWVASGEGVLRNSIDGNSNLEDEPCAHVPYRLTDSSTVCFFRDDGLSDLIGFSYAQWDPNDAVADLVNHLENIRRQCETQPGAVVAIILDGENAWGHYPANGYDFLRLLYSEIVAHPDLELTTFSEYLDHQAHEARRLDRLIAGSWVYGTLSTWVGHAEKNRAWDMLIAAKRVFDTAIEKRDWDAAKRRELEFALAACEGSDWFWWLDDHHEAAPVSQFQRLLSLHLKRVYELMGEPLPDDVRDLLSRAVLDDEGRPMLTAQGERPQ